MAFIFKLERTDGTPIDPPTFRSSPGTSWKIGDLLYLGSRTLRVVDVQQESDSEADAVLVVEPV